MARESNLWLLLAGVAGVVGLLAWANRSSSTPTGADSAAPGSWPDSSGSDASVLPSSAPFAPVNPFDSGASMNVLDLNSLTHSNSSLEQRRAAFQPYFDQSSAAHALPYGLLLQQGVVESNLLPQARSNMGAVGIMQMVPTWFPGAGQDAVADIERAATEMARLFSVFGSWTLALAAYNAGQGNVQKYGNRVPPFSETRNYVQKILGPLGLTEPGVLYA